MAGESEKKDYSRGTKTFRSFIAIEIPGDLKESLIRIQERFRKTGERVSWVKPGGMHITLKFLGDIEEESISQIGEEIGHVCSNRDPIKVKLCGAGVFPNMKQPRILWIGIREGAKEIQQVFEALDPRLSEIGFPRDKRPFRPHVTLGRIKHLRDRQGFAVIVKENQDSEVGTMTAKSIQLMESRLRPEGALYRPRLTVEFCR